MKNIFSHIFSLFVVWMFAGAAGAAIIPDNIGTNIFTETNSVSPTVYQVLPGRHSQERGSGSIWNNGSADIIWCRNTNMVGGKLLKAGSSDALDIINTIVGAETNAVYVTVPTTAGVTNSATVGWREVLWQTYPVASFSVTPTIGMLTSTGFPVSISDASWASPPLSNWLWYVDGYGFASNGTFSAWTFTSAGTHRIELAVNNGYQTQSTHVDITITNMPKPNVSFDATPFHGIAPLTCVFSNTSSASATGFVWAVNGISSNMSSSAAFTNTFADPGNYLVELTAKNMSGSNRTGIIVYALKSLFGISSAGGALSNGSHSVTITNQSTGFSITNTVVVWGDGNSSTSSAHTVSHDYIAPGTNTVSLILYSVDGTNASSSTVTVTNSAPPVASFSSGVHAGTNALSVLFTNASTHVNTALWGFGDGNSSASTSNVTHTYSRTGTFNVALTIWNGYGVSNATVSSAYVVVTNNIPTAAITATPSAGVVPVTSMLADTSLGVVTNRLWSIGTNTYTSSTVTKTFSTTGANPVSLTVWNETGSNAITVYVTATNYTPVVNFVGDVLSGLNPLTVVFTNQTVGAQTNVLWGFGDGSISATTNATHTYTNAGTYSVSLTAWNTGGSNAKVRTSYVTVTNNMPVASFVATPTSGTNGTSISFLDASLGVVTNRLWNFGDGNLSNTVSDSTVQHAYSSNAIYNVSLTVRNATGSDTKTRLSYVTITNDVPVASFTADPLTGTNGTVVTFTDDSIGVITNRLWDFGDGSTSNTISEISVQHTYSSNAVYSVSLTVRNSTGANTVTRTEYITIAP